MEIEDVRRIVVHPGETLVFRVPPGITPEQAASMRLAIKEYLPDGVGFMVVSRDVDLEVVADAVARS